MVKKEKRTGKLFGKLWKEYGETKFNSSVNLFAKRLEANSFDLKYFNGKTCLDAGCGGGRNSISLSELGAKKVVGLDIGKEGLIDAKKRSNKHSNIEYIEGSIASIPFRDNFFDFVLCSGVVHHTYDPLKGFKELIRVLKPGGHIFLLIYSSGGIRWPAIMDYRSALEKVSSSELISILKDNNIPENTIRTVIDDLFVPIIDFYTFEKLSNILKELEVDEINRWTEGRFDHEENLEDYIEDLAKFAKVFELGVESSVNKSSFVKALAISDSYLKILNFIKEGLDNEDLSEEDAMRTLIGPGHHRLIGKKRGDS